jgi:NhaA family Na+:H+ antiporter
MRSHTLAHPALAFTHEHYLWLPLGGLLALAWANTAPESYFTFATRLSFPVNEIGMALFFALVTQEVVEEMMPHGALHSWKRWLLPVIGAVGGAVGATATYFMYISVKHEPVLQLGWLAAGAFDIAFSYFVVKSIFKRHPAVSFLLVMAIVTNAAGMIAAALLYQPVTVRPGGAVLMMAAIAVAMVFRRRRVHRFWPYLAVCGPLSWWALYIDGFHPALALVPIVPFLPHQPRSAERFDDSADAPLTSPRHFEHRWNYAVQLVLFLFGLVNAGVLLHRHGTGTWALMAAALGGRPIGILAAIGIAMLMGLRLPPRLHWRDLVVVALAASSGFTFALFAAVAVYPVGPILAELTLGAVLSGIGIIAAFAVARVLKVGRFTMITRTTALLTVAFLLTPLTAAWTRAQAGSAEIALRHFTSAIDSYVHLHRRLEAKLPPMRLTERAQDIFEASDAMAAAIRRARPDAREGDMFDSAARAFIRTRIADTLAARGIRPADLIAVNVEEADEHAPQPVVNGRFPWMRAAGLWPCVLAALPGLPEELEYRMVGSDLVLVDVHANLVVDVLRNAVQ